MGVGGGGTWRIWPLYQKMQNDATSVAIGKPNIRTCEEFGHTLSTCDVGVAAGVLASSPLLPALFYPNSEYSFLGWYNDR